MTVLCRGYFSLLIVYGWNISWYQVLTVFSWQLIWSRWQIKVSFEFYARCVYCIIAEWLSVLLAVYPGILSLNRFGQVMIFSVWFRWVLLTVLIAVHHSFDHLWAAYLLFDIFALRYCWVYICSDSILPDDCDGS